MPGDNFLRFVLFHPDAGTVLGEHESSWCLPMLAHFAAAVERHGQDRGLQSIRRDIAQDPIMEAAYRQGLPHWIRRSARRPSQHDGAVRPLLHPDPRWGATTCRIVSETPNALENMGYTRLTLVLRETRRPADVPRGPRRPRRSASHLSVVPFPGGVRRTRPRNRRRSGRRRHRGHRHVTGCGLGKVGKILKSAFSGRGTTGRGRVVVRGTGTRR